MGTADNLQKWIEWPVSFPLRIHCVRISGNRARNARNTQGTRKRNARNPQGTRKRNARNPQGIQATTQGIRKTRGLSAWVRDSFAGNMAKSARLARIRQLPPTPRPSPFILQPSSLILLKLVWCTQREYSRCVHTNAHQRTPMVGYPFFGPLEYTEVSLAGTV
jgi:hypothetical protein